MEVNEMSQYGGAGRRLVVNIGYDPLVNDLGDNTGERSVPDIGQGVVVNIYDPTGPGLGDDTGPVAVHAVPEGVRVTVAYDPILDDLGDDTGEGGLPNVQGVQVNIYDPTQPGLGDDTGRPKARRALVINISHDLMRAAFG